MIGQSTSHDLFESSFEGLTSLTYHINDNTSAKAFISYDTGARGFYSSLSLKYYQDLSKNSFLTFNVGSSFTYDFYDRDGVNDLFARITYTHNINDYISASPFIGSSIQLEDNTSDILYGGLLFEVSF